MGCRSMSTIIMMNANVDSFINKLTDKNTSAYVGKSLVGLYQTLLLGRAEPNIKGSVRAFLDANNVSKALNDVKVFIGNFISPSIKWNKMSLEEIAGHINTLSVGKRDEIYHNIRDYARQLNSYIGDSKSLQLIQDMDISSFTGGNFSGSDYRSWTVKEIAKQGKVLSVGNVVSTACNWLGLGARYSHHAFEQAPGVGVVMRNTKNLQAFADSITAKKSATYDAITSLIDFASQERNLDPKKCLEAANEMMKYADTVKYEDDETVLLNKLNADVRFKDSADEYAKLISEVKDAWFQLYYGKDYKKGIKNGDWIGVVPAPDSMIKAEETLGIEYAKKILEYLNDYDGDINELSNGEIRTLFTFSSDIPANLQSKFSDWANSMYKRIKNGEPDIEHSDSIEAYVEGKISKFMDWAIKEKNRTGFIPYTADRISAEAELDYTLIDVAPSKYATGNFLDQVEKSVASTTYKANTLLNSLQSRSLIAVTSNPKSKYYKEFMDWYDKNLDRTITGTGTYVVDTVDKLALSAIIEKERLVDPASTLYDAYKKSVPVLSDLYDRVSSGNQTVKSIVGTALDTVAEIDAVLGYRNDFAKAYNRGENYLDRKVDDGRTVRELLIQRSRQIESELQDLYKSVGGPNNLSTILNIGEVDALFTAKSMLKELTITPKTVRSEAIKGAQNLVNIMLKNWSGVLHPDDMLQLAKVASEPIETLKIADMNFAMEHLSNIAGEYSGQYRGEVDLMLRRMRVMQKFLKKQVSTRKKSSAAFNGSTQLMTGFFKGFVTGLLSASGITNKLAARMTSLVNATKSQVNDAVARSTVAKFLPEIDNAFDEATSEIVGGVYRDWNVVYDKVGHDSVISRTAAMAGHLFSENAQLNMTRGLAKYPMLAFDTAMIAKRGKFKHTELPDWFVKNMTMQSEGHKFVRGYIKHYLRSQFLVAKSIAGKMTPAQEASLVRQVIRDERDRMTRLNAALFGDFGQASKHPMSWFSMLEPQGRIDVITNIVRSNVFVFKHALAFSTIKTVEGLTNFMLSAYDGMNYKDKSGYRDVMKLTPTYGAMIIMMFEAVSTLLEQLADDEDIKDTNMGKVMNTGLGLLSSTSVRSINPISYGSVALNTGLAGLKFMLGIPMTETEFNSISFSYGRASGGPLFGAMATNMVKVGLFDNVDMTNDLTVKEYKRVAELTKGMDDTKDVRFLMPLIQDITYPYDIGAAVLKKAIRMTTGDLPSVNKELFIEDQEIAQLMKVQLPIMNAFGKDQDNVAFAMNMFQLIEGVTYSMRALESGDKNNYAEYNMKKLGNLMTKMFSISSYRMVDSKARKGDVQKVVDHLERKEILQPDEEVSILLANMKEFLGEKKQEELEAQNDKRVIDEKKRDIKADRRKDPNNIEDVQKIRQQKSNSRKIKAKQEE